MQNLFRRHAWLTIVVAFAVTAVQAFLLVLVIRVYRDAANHRVGEISLGMQAALVEDELEAKRPWPEIEQRVKLRLAAVADDDEMAVYDERGALLMRSSGIMPESD